MKISGEQTKALKAAELEMLRLFLGVCDELNLRYYIIGGTLLGAVRHKGFIPWDDDIDVGMPREDYQKFLSQGQAYLPENYFIQTFETDPDWPANFAKIRNSATTFVESSVGKRNINHGLYIDIFPLDYYPEKRSWIFRLQNRFLTMRVSTAFTVSKRKLRTRIAIVLACLLYPSHKGALIRRDKLYKSVKKTGMMANNCGAWGDKEIVPAQWFGEGCELEFEGLIVKAPKEYDKWLSQVYGDYMTPPPMEKRVGHHYVDKFDLERPYTYYSQKGDL